MYLCTQYNSGSPTFTEVTNVADCSGYITDMATNFNLSVLTYSDANTILSAVAGLFAVAFITRFIINFLLNR